MGKTFSISDLYYEHTKAILARDSISNQASTHGTTIGNVTEFIIRDFLRQVMPVGFVTSTGQAVSSTGSYTPQIDVFIHVDQPGAIISRNEGDTVLAQSDFIKCFIEVKRSINRDTLKEICNHSESTFDIFNESGRTSSYLDCAICLRADMTENAIVKELNKYASHKTPGYVLVLDCEEPAKDILEEYKLLSGHFKDNTKAYGSCLRELIRNKLPYGILFGRQKSQANTYAYKKIQVDHSPLLEFVARVDEHIQNLPLDITNKNRKIRDKIKV